MPSESKKTEKLTMSDELARAAQQGVEAALSTNEENTTIGATNTRSRSHAATQGVKPRAPRPRPPRSPNKSTASLPATLIPLDKKDDSHHSTPGLFQTAKKSAAGKDDTDRSLTSHSIDAIQESKTVDPMALRPSAHHADLERAKQYTTLVPLERIIVHFVIHNTFIPKGCEDVTFSMPLYDLVSPGNCLHFESDWQKLFLYPNASEKLCDYLVNRSIPSSECDCIDTILNGESDEKLFRFDVALPDDYTKNCFDMRIPRDMLKAISAQNKILADVLGQIPAHSDDSTDSDVYDTYIKTTLTGSLLRSFASLCRKHKAEAFHDDYSIRSARSHSRSGSRSQRSPVSTIKVPTIGLSSDEQHPKSDETKSVSATTIADENDQELLLQQLGPNDIDELMAKEEEVFSAFETEPRQKQRTRRFKTEVSLLHTMFHISKRDAAFFHLKEKHDSTPKKHFEDKELVYIPPLVPNFKSITSEELSKYNFSFAHFQAHPQCKPTILVKIYSWKMHPDLQKVVVLVGQRDPRLLSIADTDGHELLQYVIFDRLRQETVEDRASLQSYLGDEEYEQHIKSTRSPQDEAYIEMEHGRPEQSIKLESKDTFVESMRSASAVTFSEPNDIYTGLKCFWYRDVRDKSITFGTLVSATVTDPDTDIDFFINTHWTRFAPSDERYQPEPRPDLEIVPARGLSPQIKKDARPSILQRSSKSQKPLFGTPADRRVSNASDRLLGRQPIIRVSPEHGSPTTVPINNQSQSRRSSRYQRPPIAPARSQPHSSSVHASKSRVRTISGGAPGGFDDGSDSSDDNQTTA